MGRTAGSVPYMDGVRLDRRVQRVAYLSRRRHDDGDDTIMAGVCPDCPKRLATKNIWTDLE